MTNEHVNVPVLSDALRSLKLAESCISNLACYSAGWIEKDGTKVLLNDKNFWIRTNGNFLDIATLDWCKLFIDKSQDNRSFSIHNWKSFFPNHDEWLKQMFITSSITKSEFEEGGKSIVDYRNKHLAHLEKTEIPLFYPRVNLMLKTVSHLHLQLRTSAGFSISGYFDSVEEFYESEFTDARKIIIDSSAKNNTSDTFMMK